MDTLAQGGVGLAGAHTPHPSTRVPPPLHRRHRAGGWKLKLKVGLRLEVMQHHHAPLPQGRDDIFSGSSSSSLCHVPPLGSRPTSLNISIRCLHGSTNYRVLHRIYPARGYIFCKIQWWWREGKLPTGKINGSSGKKWRKGEGREKIRQREKNYLKNAPPCGCKIDIS